MAGSGTHRVERWEFDAAENLIMAVLLDDRARFDGHLAVHADDDIGLQADLIAIGLTVAAALRWTTPLLHRRPSAAARAKFLDALAASQFADLVDLELAKLAVARLYQRGLPDPLRPSIDPMSTATCLALAAWRLWQRRGVLPRDRYRRKKLALHAVLAGTRLHGLRTNEWIRMPPPTTT